MLPVHGNGVDVGSGDTPIKVTMLADIEIQQLIDQVMGSRAAFDVQNRFNGFEPFASLLWILVEKH